MRTTLDLPDDLQNIVQSLAASKRRTLSATAVELMRRGLALPSAVADTQHEADVPPVLAFKTHPVMGLPVFRMPRRVTPEDVASLDDA